MNFFWRRIVGLQETPVPYTRDELLFQKLGKLKWQIEELRVDLFGEIGQQIAAIRDSVADLDGAHSGTRTLLEIIAQELGIDPWNPSWSTESTGTVRPRQALEKTIKDHEDRIKALEAKLEKQGSA
jgi:hypothetical protein